MRRPLTLLALALCIVLAGAAAAQACGGLIGRGGAVNLIRTTTLAAYHDGVEHYVTAFSFFGGGGEFGSIVPLPGIPTKVDRGGDWTLQRLVRETQPQRELGQVALAAADGVRSAKAEVLLETKVDALDITVLKGGGTAVGDWAGEHGFLLPPDAPEVLDFYARRSPIFMAARFDAEAAKAKGQEVGDGTPIHLTIPTPDPWVPLRILGLGRQPNEQIEADVYLLTPVRPSLLPGDREGLILRRSEQASAGLIADLRSDRGMEWIPESGMWLSYLRVDSPARDLRYDLAIDATGRGEPSREAAGLPPVQTPAVPAGRPARLVWPALALLVLLAFSAGWALRRTPATP